MQRILLSLGMIVFVGAVAVGATGAFFNDTETSTGNTFAAGDIDLKIDNSSYAVDYNIPSINTPTGAFLNSSSTSWTLADLIAGTHKFFNFVDLKPGDLGEDTISIHVGSNNAWMCAAARLTADLDNSITEPEDETDLDDDNADATVDGDLDSALNFAFWVDDGDNVFEPVAGQNGGVAETVFLSGPLSNITAPGNKMTLADSSGSILGGNAPIPGDTTFYIGKIWCYGTPTAGTLVQDGLNTGSPLTLGTGWTCNGVAVGNEGQTDSAVGDMQFYAVQSRNNTTFTCANDYTPVWP